MGNKRNALMRLSALLLILTLTMTGCSGLIYLSYVPAATDASTTAFVLSTEETEPSAWSETTAQTEPTAESAETTEQSASTETTEPMIDPDDEALIRWQNAGQRDYLPDEKVEMVPFSQMQYVRPDTDALYADFEDLTHRAEESTEADAEALLSEYFDLSTRYVSFYSMNSLANVLHSLDTTESYYQDEYNFCDGEKPNLEKKLEALLKAFAASACRNKLEELYFGEGFFEKYDDYEVYTNPEYLRLSKEEAAILTEYRDLTADIQVTYQGQTKPLEEWLQSKNYGEYVGALQAYYEQYNGSVGEVYVRLVKVRQQLAKALDYDSFAEYSYQKTYSRDYTPEQGAAFLEDIRVYLVPVLESAASSWSLSTLDYGAASEDSMKEMLRTAAENIGGTVWDAYRFMQTYELCDIGKSIKKLDASFQTYLFDYEAPFVFVNARGTGQDYMTFSHEFGHFTDSFYNYGANEDLETAETFSQSMEFLAVTYTDTLTAKQKENLIKLNLKDTLQTFVYQAAYADFESRVYALDPEDVTLDHINDIFRECCIDYGIYVPSFDFYYSQSWIDILHFFEVPYYIISYCVSAENALQVYRLEEESSGAGVEAFNRLLNRDYEAGVQQVMEDAELESPFREGVLEQTAEFFIKKLKLKVN